ncbi:MAG: efflux RND transporter periplasmic adaptor subunit [Candidatus Eisenbacteria bacterium]|nr:efflux RND transporter periplasmic adaptor subunit [Candidatus Eisenbacteria bacterium]
MKLNRWAVLGLAAIVVVAAVWVVRARQKPAAPKYRTAAVERGDVTATVSATGTVNPVMQVEVGSQVSGTLNKLYVDYNSRVKAGQVLCTIDPSAFKARLAQAEAALARADAALKDGKRQLARAQELVHDNYISQADVEAAEVAVEQRQADVKQAQAQLQSAQVDLNNTTIRAPIDGVVISRSIDVGQTVAASLQAPKLFVIANDLTQMQVETSIDEADIGRIRPGLPVAFNVDAFPDQEFEGKVSQVRLEPITDQNVVTYTTVIATRNDALQLRPGMTANVTVTVASRKDVLKVPNAALRFRLPGSGGSGAGGWGGGGGGGTGNGAMRRSFSWLLDRIAPPAYAQGRGGSGTAGAGRAGGRPAAVRDSASAVRGGGPARAASGGESAGARPWAKGLTGGRNFAGAPGSGPSPEYRPGRVYLLQAGKPVEVRVMSGITDGTMTEVRGDNLKEGDLVVTGIELAQSDRGQDLQPPAGMGGPRFGPRPGGRR